MKSLFKNFIKDIITAIILFSVLTILVAWLFTERSLFESFQMLWEFINKYLKIR